MNWSTPVVLKVVAATAICAIGALVAQPFEYQLNNAFGFMLLLLGPAVVAAILGWWEPRAYISAGAAAAAAASLVFGLGNAFSNHENLFIVVLVGTAVSIWAVTMAGVVLLAVPIYAVREYRSR